MKLHLTPRLTLPLALLSCFGLAREVAARPVAHPAEAPSGTRSVAILIYEGVELLDFAGPGEVFAAARGPQGRGFRVFTVAATPAPIRSQGFVEVTPEFSFADAPAPDIVVVPGGNVPEDRAHVEWIQRCAKTSELVMSVCNGAHLLADAGLLDGLEATTHHGSIEALAADHPRVRVLTNRRFVDSGKIMTAAGVSAGIDGALHVVERLLGDEAARRTARYMEYDWRPEEIARLHTEPGRHVNEGPAFELAALASRAGVESALARYRGLDPRPDERALNHAGYFLLRQEKATEARALLELAALAFPDSPNAHDSLATACEQLGDSTAAIRHAETALARLDSAKGLDASLVETIRNSSLSRLARLGRGDAKALVFGCPPCGGPCDEPRYLNAGRCPGCGMTLIDRAAE